MIGRQQSVVFGDDPVPVMVSVAGERQIKTILHPDQPLHRVGRRRVHANLAIPIHRHEPEGGVNRFIHYRQVQTMLLGDSRPVMNAGAAQRINSQMNLRACE